MSTDAANSRPGDTGPFPAATDAPLLERFLAERDAPCPSCGYNLRGSTGDKCPECAHAVVLGVVRPGPGAALTWFLLLAFGWVFVAGVMNSVRNVERIHLYVSNSQVWGFQALPRAALINGQNVVITGPSGSLPPPAGFWETAWQVVPVTTWIGAAWSLGLAVGCAVGLLMMARRRARPFGASGELRMVRLACGLFAVYASWHIVTFILEFS